MGADQLISDWKSLSQKNIALVVNQTSTVGTHSTHLVDSLLAHHIQIKTIFAPEHGFRGTADAGELISNSIDSKTGISIISLYGKNKKPTQSQLKNVDLVIFDIQDVGARFYTYISTLYYVMEACSDHQISLWVLDRPNPNDYVDGPVMQDSLRSFVGIVPIPLLHGLTIGELASMINGERWLHSKSRKCDLRVIKMSGWKHHQPYSLPIKPSPNLPNDLSIKLYPSLCLFEATPFSIGRGTTFPFQVIGYPDSTLGHFSFTPISLPGFEKNPLQKENLCYGIDLRNETIGGGFSLRYFIDFYRKSGLGTQFFTQPRFFDQLVGNSMIRQHILTGRNESEIKSLWLKDLTHYRKLRKKYLLYKE
ncbi:MAG: DUF1343 domain-containing protein [Bacteroidales bacterium]|nr:DUF1343 domain-containing protein [Bacteroidales bacterium]